jgi:hypothetical protein
MIIRIYSPVSLSSTDHESGGTAGCVVARRLAENPKTTVLLIEAGKSEAMSQFLPYQLQFLKSPVQTRIGTYRASLARNWTIANFTLAEGHLLAVEVAATVRSAYVEYLKTMITEELKDGAAMRCSII